ncbi:hypothetical protein QNM99_12835 [Pseudomonas sp. PCH446]
MMAAASPWLNQAMSPALNELARASTAIRITASPARAGRELRNQRIMAVALGQRREHRHIELQGMAGNDVAAGPWRSTSKELSIVRSPKILRVTKARG